MVGIYKFTNKITGQSYIGQSKNIENRYTQHKTRHEPNLNTYENTYFHQALYHYGFWNFDFEVLEQCEQDQLDDREKYYIKKYNTIYPYGYNKTWGGQDAPHTMKLENISQIEEIYDLLRHSKYSNSEIGSMYNISDQSVSDINSGRIWFSDKITYPIRNGRKKTDGYYCRNCGRKIDKIGKTGYCYNCFVSERRLNKNIPSKELLYNLLLENSFCAIGKKYGVTDNAVRKWCDIYGIPRSSSYYKNLSA